MKQYFVDANAILRFLLNDVPEQVSIIRSYFDRAKIGELTITVTLFVFSELVYALNKYYHFKKEEIVEKLFTLLKIPYLEFEKREIMIEALLLYNQSSVSFVDAFFVTEARIAGYKLLTFDNKLKKLTSN